MLPPRQLDAVQETAVVGGGLIPVTAGRETAINDKHCHQRCHPRFTCKDHRFSHTIIMFLLELQDYITNKILRQLASRLNSSSSSRFGKLPNSSR